LCIKEGSSGGKKKTSIQGEFRLSAVTKVETLGDLTLVVHFGERVGNYAWSSLRDSDGLCQSGPRGSRVVMQALKDLEVSKWVFVPLTWVGIEKGCFGVS